MDKIEFLDVSCAATKICYDRDFADLLLNQSKAGSSSRAKSTLMIFSAAPSCPNLTTLRL
jgi:hypothetical protein